MSKENLLSPFEDTGLFASELVSARSERGWSQADLSEQSGVSRSALKAYETGRNLPGSRELLALCKALKKTPNQLLLGLDPGYVQALDAAKIVRNLTDDFDIMKSRMSALVNLLTRSEFDSLYTLARSIAISRHGADVVQQVLGQADSLTRMHAQLADEQLDHVARTIAPLDGREIVASVAQKSAPKD